jgi:hypothetical protein
MTARLLAITILLTAGTALPATVDARTSLRCPDGLIRNDDPRILVLMRCGDPVDVQATSIFHRAIIVPGELESTRERRVGSRILLGDAWIHGQEEVWTYNFGPSRFMRQIRFVNGRVREIEALGYGFRDAP